MKPFTFEELQKILELKDTELITDELIFDSVLTTVEKQLGYTLEDRNYNEIQTVRDSQVFTNFDNITEMINIIDMNTKQRVPNCVIDGRRIIFIDPKLEGHVVFLNYNAGFLPLEFPADLKEAIVKLFILKKNNFIKNLNDAEPVDFVITEDIQNILNSYRKKTL